MNLTPEQLSSILANRITPESPLARGDQYVFSQTSRNGNDEIDRSYLTRDAQDDPSFYDVWDADTGNYLAREKKQKDTLFSDFLLAAGGLYGLGSFIAGAPLGIGGSAAATGGSGLGGGGVGTFNAAVDSQLANAALGSDALAGYGAAGAGGVSAAPIAATASGGLGSTLSGLLPEGMKGWLGPVATLTGGLLGSKPQTQSATSTRTTDPRFDPAINGLLGMLQQQINQPRPTNTLGNIAPRGNGFNLFTGR